MDPFELLKADHEKVAGLFDRLEAVNGKGKLEIFQQIKSELELHTHIEEKIFYPALKAPAETHDLTLEAYEEHAVVKSLLSELSRAKTASDDWQAKAKVLRENVEHHVQEEENELFDKAEDALDSVELEKLGDRMAAEKARKLGQPVAKVTKTTASSRKAGKGLLSTIANFVGLGAGKEKKSTTRTSKKKAASRKSSKSATGSAKKKTKSRSTAKTKRATKKRG